MSILCTGPTLTPAGVTACPTGCGAPSSTNTGAGTVVIDGTAIELIPSKSRFKAPASMRDFVAEFGMRLTNVQP
jgi:hypothetical protein